MEEKKTLDRRFPKWTKFLNWTNQSIKTLFNKKSKGSLEFIQKLPQQTSQKYPSNIISEQLTQFDPKKGIETEWWFATPYGLGVSRGINVSEVRNFAQESFCQMVMNTIKKEIINTEWDFINTDEEDEQDYSEEKQKAKDFFSHINDQNQSWNDIVRKMMPDWMEIDAGALVKYYNLADELKGIYARDGGTFTKQTLIDGTILAWYQYSWRQPSGYPVHFEPNEVVYFMSNPRAYKMYGFAPLQSVLQIVQLMIHSTRYNKEFFENNANPDRMINLKGMADEKLIEFKDGYKKKFKAKAHETGFTNVDDIKIENLTLNNRDMEWLAGQKWYFHLIFGAYGLSPTEAGFYEDALKAGMEGQERVTVRSAIKPYLKILEDKVNSEILPEVLGLEKDEEGKYPNLTIQFKYMPKDHVAEKEDNLLWKDLLQLKVVTINEYRKKMGMKAVKNEYADNQFQMQEENKEMRDNMFEQNGKFPQETEEGKKPKEDEKPIPPKKPVPSKKPEKKSISKDLVEFTSQEIVEEAEDYEDFLDKWFTHFEKKVVKSLESGILEKDYNVFEKSFGDFLKMLFGVINTVNFKRQISKFIKIPMKEGLRAAEDELNIDIGISDSFNQKSEFFAEQQLNGYTLPDGKKWFGIKGVTADLQTDVYNKVSKGVTEKKSTSEITKDVKETFGVFEDSRAMMIARTETNRFVNEGKIQAYRDSGLEGNKQWIAYIDENTSDICRRLNNQIVPLEKHFRDEKTKKEYFVCPAHVNCRSTIRFIPED